MSSFSQPKNLSFSAHCPLCRTRFRPGGTEMIEQGERAHLMYAQCSSCGGAIIALISLQEGNVSTVGVVTDLMKDEIVKYRAVDSVGIDDVLSVHEELMVNS